MTRYPLDLSASVLLAAISCMIFEGGNKLLPAQYNCKRCICPTEGKQIHGLYRNAVWNDKAAFISDNNQCSLFLMEAVSLTSTTTHIEHKKRTLLFIVFSFFTLPNIQTIRWPLSQKAPRTTWSLRRSSSCAKLDIFARRSKKPRYRSPLKSQPLCIGFIGCDRLDHPQNEIAPWRHTNHFGSVPAVLASFTAIRLSKSLPEKNAPRHAKMNPPQSIILPLVKNQWRPVFPPQSDYKRAVRM